MSERVGPARKNKKKINNEQPAILSGNSMKISLTTGIKPKLFVLSYSKHIQQHGHIVYLARTSRL
jgi:hypothetical protein